jgi:mono/diheme cytochrome c family protein
MAKICLGSVVVVVLLGIVFLMILLLGFVPSTANAVPPTFEQQVATRALDASINRHAPRIANPYPVDDQSLIAGMKIYTMNCAVCHGALDAQPSPLEHSFYPPVPQLVLRPIRGPEWRTFYVVRTGIRYTGMPAWEKGLNEQEMWKVTAFLSRIENLPPNVAAYWHEAFAPKPSSSAP